jgi:glutathione S-transferase
MVLRLFGRSSSHFTRCARIFASELGIVHDFQPVHNLLSHARADYADNPALKLPILVSDDTTWYGTANICRELARHAQREVQVEWPESLCNALAANAQELVLQGMATEVTLVMSTIGVDGAKASVAYLDKMRISLVNSVRWLDQQLPLVQCQLRPECTLSFFEVTLFCFITHLQFRAVLDAAEFTRLQAFCQHFAQRASARSSEYRFDPAPQTGG